MCGLFGFVNRDIPKLKLIDLIKQSLLMNSLRGTDGAGVAVVDSAGAVSVYKKPMSGADFAQLGVTNTMLTKCDLPVFGLVHNRSGTSGGNTIDTSHPINYKHITLVHNGSVHSVTSLGSDYLTHDSTAIAIALADKSEREALELIQGSFALMWYNQQDGSFNVAKNEQRPLYMATVKKSRTVLYGSEDGMLLWLAERNDIPIKEIIVVAAGTHTKTWLAPEAKSKAYKFTPYAPVASYSGPVDWGYTITAEDEKFIGSYQGIIDLANNKKKFKFKRDSDPMYAWLTEYNEITENLLIKDRRYNLQADEPRVTKSNSSNLEALLLSTVPVELVLGISTTSLADQFYKPGQEVEFNVDSVFTSRKNSAYMSFIGLTEDSSMMEVRGFGIMNPPPEKNRVYIGVIQNLVPGKKGKYILVEAGSVRPKISQDLLSDAKCGWCDTPLSNKELVDNRAYGLANEGSLCNVCNAQYTRGFNS